VLTTTPPFPLLDQWREAFGTHFADGFSGCNLFLLATMPSAKPDVVDAENDSLEKQCQHWLYALGLLQELNAAWALVSGANEGGYLRQRRCTTFTQLHGRPDSPAHRLRYPKPRIDADIARTAALLSDRVLALDQRGGYRRFTWGLAVWQLGMRPMNHLHQFVRSLDGIIRTRQGRSKKDFIRRCRTIIGTDESLEGLPGELYQLRSAAEHLNGHDEVFDEARVPQQEREIRLALRYYQAERIAGYAYARVLGDAELLEHFETDDRIDAFWRLSEDERRVIWGAPMDPTELLIPSS